MAKILRKRRAKLQARQMDYEKTMNDPSVKNKLAFKRPGSLKK